MHQKSLVSVMVEVTSTMLVIFAANTEPLSVQLMRSGELWKVFILCDGEGKWLSRPRVKRQTWMAPAPALLG